MRRLLLILGRGLALLLGALSALGASVLFHLPSEPGRRAVEAQASHSLTELLQGDFRAGRIEQLGAGQLVLSDLRIWDRPANGERKGPVVAEVGRAELDLDMFALLDGEVHVRNLALADTTVSLAELEDGLRLVRAVSPVESSPSTEGAGENPPIKVDAIELRGGRLEGLPEGYTIRDIRVVGAFAMDPTPEVTVEELSFSVAQEGEPLLEASVHGTAALGPDEESTLVIEVHSNQTELVAEGTLVWAEDGPGPAEVSLQGELHPELLLDLGYPDAAAQLAGPMSFDLEASGTIEDATARLAVSSEGGDAIVEAHRNGDAATLAVETERLSLEGVLHGVPGVVAGRAELTVDGLADAPRDLRLVGTHVRYDEWEASELVVVGEIDEDAITISNLNLPHLTGSEGHLDLQATVGFDQSIEATLDCFLPELAVDENFRRLAPGARAGLRANLSATVAPEAASIDVDGTVAVEQARLSGLQVASLRVEGSASGDPTRPTVSVEARGRGLRAGDLVVTSARLRGSGGPESYRANADVRLGGERSGTSLEVEGHLRRYDDRIRGGASLGVRGLLGAPLEFDVLGAEFIFGDRVHVDRVELSGRGIGVRGQGDYWLDGRTDFEVQVDELRAEEFRTLAGIEDLRGILRGVVRGRGSARTPELEFAVALEDAVVRGVPLASVDARGTISSQRGALDLTLDAAFADEAEVDGEIHATLARRGSFVRRLIDADYTADLRTEGFTLGLVNIVAPDAPPVAGTARAMFRVRGTLRDPTIDMEAGIQNLEVELSDGAIQPLDLELRAGLAGDRGQLQLSGNDSRGALFHVGAEATLPPAILLGEGSMDALRRSPWEVEIAVSPRRVTELPISPAPPLPAVVELSAEARGGDRRPEVDATVRLSEILAVGEAAEGCENQDSGELRVGLTLREGLTELDVNGEIGGRRVIGMEASAETPIAAWVTDPASFSIPPLRLAGSIDGLEFESLPVACRFVRGTVHGAFEGQDILGAAPQLALEAQVDNLQVGQEDPVRASADIALEPDRLSVDVRVRDRERDSLEVEAQLPLHRLEDSLFPTVAPEPWEATVELRQVPMAVLLAPVPNLAQPYGQMEGQLRIVGRGAEFSTTGQVELQDVGFVVRDPVTRIDGLRGRIAFEEDAVVVQGLSLRDRDGELRLDGRLGLDGLDPAALDFTVTAEDYPLRNQGIIAAYVDSRIGIDGTLGGLEPELTIRIRDTALRLSDRVGDQVQSLAQHDDVLYEDDPRYSADAFSQLPGDEQTSNEESAGEEDAPAQRARPLRVRIDALEPFWVRRDDLAIQLSTELSYAGGRLAGSVELRRGFLALLGKEFDLSPGSLTFDGAAEIDPIVDLTAVHTLDDDNTVSVHITGRLREPVISYSTTVPDVSSDQEILQILVEGRATSTETAETQATNILTGLVAGTLSTLTRREIGAFLPRLSVETQGVEGARVRAGIQADALIPSFLEDIVRSAYVEGFFGSGDESSDGAPSGGFVIELYFPYDIVTSGSFEQPNNWSVDFTWEP
ncbi:MAG: translocation/assembly module TamB domain-containing protein [Myxococcota bacterium]